MFTARDDRKNGIDSTVTSTYTAFVEGHKTTLEYMLKFGSPMEQAKAGILIDLAGGLI